MKNSNQQPLILDQILEYYDEPLVFLARGKFHKIYLCTLLSDEGPYPQKYLGVQISNYTLFELSRQLIDLRSAILNTSTHNGQWYIIERSTGSLLIEETFLAEQKAISDDLLPDEGFFLEMNEGLGAELAGHLLTKSSVFEKAHSLLSYPNVEIHQRLGNEFNQASTLKGGVVLEHLKSAGSPTRYIFINNIKAGKPPVISHEKYAKAV